MKKNTLILFLIILMILYATKFANAGPVCDEKERNVCTYTFYSGWNPEQPYETMVYTFKDGVIPPESMWDIKDEDYVYAVGQGMKSMIVNDGTQNIQISVGIDNNGLSFSSPGTFDIHYDDYGSEDGSITHGSNYENCGDICSWQYNYDNGVLKSATYTDYDEDGNEVERVLETYQWENGKLVVYDANGKRVEGTYDNLKAYLLSQYANEDSDPTDILDSDFGTVGYVPSRLKTPPSTDNENSARCIAGQNRKDCRIYTIDEANAVAGPVNRVSIKYR